MWEEILRQAVENGLWAVLFCCLLAYLLRDGRARENKYQQTIVRLCEHLDALEDVRETVNETLNELKKEKNEAVKEFGFVGARTVVGRNGNRWNGTDNNKE